MRKLLIRCGGGASVHIFLERGDFSVAEGYNMRPVTAVFTSICLDSPRIVSQNHHFIALCNELHRVECQCLLRFSYRLTECRQGGTSFVASGKRHFLDFGKLKGN